MTALNVFHEACRDRAHGRCEVNAPGCRGQGDQAHHIVTRARGVGWAGLHDPSNGAFCCSICHEWIHRNPKEATERGWLKSRPLEVA